MEGSPNPNIDSNTIFVSPPSKYTSAFVPNSPDSPREWTPGSNRFRLESLDEDLQRKGSTLSEEPNQPRDRSTSFLVNNVISSWMEDEEEYIEDLGPAYDEAYYASMYYG